MFKLIKSLFKVINPIILIVVLVACVSAVIFEKEQTIVDTKISNIYYDLFKKEFCSNYEAIILLFDNGAWAITTNYLADMVVFPSHLTDELNSKGLTINKCWLIIHNHWGLCRFSEEDKVAHRYLMSIGFKGKFAIWCHANEDVFYLEN